MGLNLKGIGKRLDDIIPGVTQGTAQAVSNPIGFAVNNIMHPQPVVGAALNRVLGPPKPPPSVAITPGYNPIPQFHFADKIKNPALGFAAQIPQAFANAPHQLGQGATLVQNDIENALAGRSIKATDFLKHYGQGAEGAFDIASLGTAAPLKETGKQAVKQGFKQVVKQGAIQAAEYAGARGAFANLNNDAKTLPGQLGKAALLTGRDIAIAAPIGAVTAGVGYGVGKGVQKLTHLDERGSVPLPGGDKPKVTAKNLPETEGLDAAIKNGDITQAEYDSLKFAKATEAHPARLQELRDKLAADEQAIRGKNFKPQMFDPENSATAAAARTDTKPEPLDALLQSEAPPPGNAADFTDVKHHGQLDATDLKEIHAEVHQEIKDAIPKQYQKYFEKTFVDPHGNPVKFMGVDRGPSDNPNDLIARFQTQDGNFIHTDNLDQAKQIFKGGVSPTDLITNQRGDMNLNAPAGKPKVTAKTVFPEEEFWQGVKSGKTEAPPEVKASFDRYQQLFKAGQGKTDEAAGLEAQLNNYYHEQNPQVVYDRAKPVGTEIPQGVSQDKLTPNQQYLKDKSASVAKNPLLGKEYLPDVAPGDLKRAITNGQATSGMVRSRGKLALNAVNGLSDSDHALLDGLRTTPAETLAKQAENPKAFLDAATKVKDYNNFTHVSGYNLGQNIGRREQYGAPLLYDMGDKQTAQTINQWRASLPLEPGYSQMRTLPDYAAGEKLGLKRLNQTFGQDLEYDINRRSSDLSQLSLARGLNQAYPGQVKVGEIPAGWKQLQIPGGQRLAMPNEIADQINTRAMPGKSTGLLGAYDKGTTGAKNLAVGGGGFHGFTEALRGMGQQALDPQAWLHPLRTAREDYYAVGGTFSKKIAQQGFDHYQNNGTMDWANLGGTTLGSKQLQGDNYTNFYDKLRSGNYVRQVHDAVFQREIPLQKLAIIDRMMQGHEDMTNADSIARATQASAAANHMFGGLNRQIDGFSPKVAKWLGRGMFSADFTESKVRLLQDALTRGGPQGSIARQAVLGKALTTAVPGVLAAAAAGTLDMSNPEELAKAVASQVLDPRIPTPFKDRYGNYKVARLPNNDISEFARVIQPMFDGSADKSSGVKHYAVARVNPLIGQVAKLATNQDYYGKPVVAQKEDGSVDVGKTALNLGSSSATIPGSNILRTLVQANPNGLKGYSEEQLAGMSPEQKNAILGKISPGEAAVNIAGARVVQDPNSPQSKSFNFQQKTVDNLGKDKPLWEQVFGKKTDQYGNPDMQIGALDSQDKAYTLLTHPQLLDAGQKINDNKRQVGVPSDPFYELPRDKQNVVLNMAVDKFRNPAEKIFIKNKNPWLNDYYGRRTAYFDQLNLPASQKTAELPEPKAPDTMTAYSQLKDSAQKAQFLGSHPELTDYFTAHDNFIRAGRAKQSLPQYDKYPEAPARVKQLMDAYASLPKGNGPNGTSPNRSAWIKSHPNEWNVLIAQFSRQAQYGLEKDASQAAYEGQDFSKTGIKDIMSLARDLGMDTGGSSRFGRGKGSGQKVALNPYQYAVSLRAGGKVATPRVSSRSGGRSRIARKSTNGKPNVSIKKSMV